MGGSVKELKFARENDNIEKVYEEDAQLLWRDERICAVGVVALSEWRKTIYGKKKRQL